ncbi:hypothetical protein LCGC14_2176480, partial [marine sediment metagenome]
LEKERLERERLKKERLERERLEREKFERKLFANNTLFMIPSWGDLLGYPTLGKYVNREISSIASDTVIFFSNYDYCIETAQGTLHCLFGLGCYFLKFEIDAGKYITDNRILTGLILSDFVYDHMATSKNVTLEKDRDVVITDKVIKVPIDLSNKRDSQKTFIQGVLMRNVFIPNKDKFLKMMEIISKKDSYKVNYTGHMLLSTHWDFYNQIVVSDKMKDESDNSYLKSVVGLNGIVFGVDQLLEEILSPSNITTIKEKVIHLKNAYSNLEFDPIYLFSLLENASAALNADTQESYSTKEEGPKESIFASAEDRIDTITNWSEKFKRKTKKELEGKPETKEIKEIEETQEIKEIEETQETKDIPKMVEQPASLQQNNIQDSSTEVIKMPEYEREVFEFKSLHSETVESKKLPPPPEVNVKEIFEYVKKVVEEDYEMCTIGEAFEIARECMRQTGVSSTIANQKEIWQMSKYANLYKKKGANLGLPPKEKEEIMKKIDIWLLKSK